MNIIRWIDQRKHWWKVFAVIFTVSVAVVGYIGYKTYQYAPPIAEFVDEQGRPVFSADSITSGQKIFLKYGLMDYGSYLGDGGMRGPDFTAEALNLTARWMKEHYSRQQTAPAASDREARLQEQSLLARVQFELKENRYDEGTNAVTLNPAQAFAFQQLVTFNAQRFGEGGDLAQEEVFKTKNYISDEGEIRDLSAFFYWGGWLCAAQRPGYTYSYTHNWPYDPMAGNIPHGGLVLWSAIGTLAVILSLGVIFYYYGKMDREAILQAQSAKMPPLATSELLDTFKPTPTQRACYKFFAVAAVLFGIQVLAGLLAISDFVNLFAWFGVEITDWIPVTVSRAWHTQVSILWIAVCWFAATIWVLPLICRPEPSGQRAWIETLFWMLVVTAVGGVVGMPLAVHGLLDFGGLWRWLGIQGWEFMQIGRLYQYLLYAAFGVWLIITMRGVWPVLRQKQTWSLPNWMVYSIMGIILMFSAGFVAAPETNFVIADFWRWCTIHMWVEAFFEVFTTIIVAYFLYLMGFVSHVSAARVVYLSAVLFLGSGLIGISHNFYWNAKSIETVALGGVLSSLQVAPLVLLTVEAWRFRHMPQSALAKLKQRHGQRGVFGLAEPFLFLVAVNFWNFMGAGVLGFMINLPIVNYYQHGTYLTVNHAHAALFGVYGNLAIAAMLFCGRWVIGPESWNPRLLRVSFWSLNIGVSLMVVMDLFPVGVHQLMAVMTDGYAFSRSQEYLNGSVFQTLTWLRGFGVVIFILGGVFPLMWFMVSRWFALKPPQAAAESFVVPPSVLAVAAFGSANGNGKAFVGEPELAEQEV